MSGVAKPTVDEGCRDIVLLRLDFPWLRVGPDSDGIIKERVLWREGAASDNETGDIGRCFALAGWFIGCRDNLAG